MIQIIITDKTELRVAKHVQRIERLLGKVIKGECKEAVEEKLDELLTLLHKQENGEVESVFLLFPILQKWLKNAIDSWYSLRIKPTPKIVTFTLSLASFLARNEDRFKFFDSDDSFFLTLVSVLKVRHSRAKPPLRLRYIKLLRSFLHHKSGIEWIIASQFWTDVYQLSVSSKNEEINVESTKFLSALLEVGIDLNEDFTNEVVKKIMTPLEGNFYKAIRDADDSKESREVASKYLKPSLKLIGNLLEDFLEKVLTDEKHCQVIIVFYQHFHLQEPVSDFMTISQTKCLAFDLGRIMFIMQFLQLYVKIVIKSINMDTIEAVMKKIKNNFLLSVSKLTVEDAIEFSNFGKLYWRVLAKYVPLPKSNQNDCIVFSSQLVIFHVLPYFCLCMIYCYELSDFEKVFGEDCIEIFISKLFKMSSHDVIRATYYWRDHLITRGDLFKICDLCNRRIRSSRKYITRDVAVIIVQTLIYHLRDITHFSTEYPRKLKFFTNQLIYVEEILELTSTLIEEFDITWQDSIESIDLLTIAFDFLILYKWPSNIVIQVLRLVRTAIPKYMAPDLALLVDATSEATVTVLGPLLFGRIHDEAVDVRKAALGVVSTLAWISNKFPSLQKVLMDSELPTLVVKMSTCDGESFVRATAIKCLQEMIQVEEIWNNALKSEDLSEKMRHILMNETEGIVRVEAATFMCVAYEHQQFPKESLDGIYETMIYSSTTDLHWEVKVRALNFWDKVIKNHLQNQGMIDDSFPNVTFSKEHRKIVTLTDSEIRKRLLKVLSQLSSIGCLGVLMSAIKDDCDMEVSKTGVKITQRLIDLFKKYNVRSDSSTPSSPAATENGMSAVASVSSGISVDESMDSPASTHPEVNEEVIDQIVNSKDVCLLKNVYTPSDYGSVSNYDIQVRKIVTPNEFLVFCQQDLNSLIAEKKNWLNGIEDLGSLLDDMLKTYDDDVNNMDCY